MLCVTGTQGAYAPHERAIYPYTVNKIKHISYNTEITRKK